MPSSDSPFIGLVNKTCPDCAEEIQVEAQLCRHCGRRFSEAEMAAGKEQAQARTSAFAALVWLYVLEGKRKVRFGWGIALTVIGGLLQVLWTAMVLFPTDESGNFKASIRFGGFMCMAMTSLPLLLPGIVLIRSARRIRREWQATLDRNEEEARRARLASRKWSRVDWGSVLSFIGVFLLVMWIWIGFFPPDKDAQAAAGGGMMCVTASLLPVLLGGYLLLRGVLAKPRDEESIADVAAASQSFGAAKLAAAVSLDEGLRDQVHEYLNRASPEDRAAFGRRLSSATPDQIRQMVRNLTPPGSKPPAL